jgi:MoaA/NifB/PqqE/SkfB family radical SAM enzyme
LLINRNTYLPTKDPDRALQAALGPAFSRYRKDFREAEGGGLFPYPLHLDLDVTTRCNLSCPMCPGGMGAKGPFPGLGIDMPWELYTEVLHEAGRLKIPSVRIGMTGEPLVLPDIERYVALAKDSGVIDISLITNGQLLTLDISKSLMEAGLTRLMVSVDAATPKTYRRVRPRGDFNRLLTNLRGFLEVRAKFGEIPVVRASFVELGENASEREKFTSLFSGLADYLAFQDYLELVPGKGSKNPSSEKGLIAPSSEKSPRAHHKSGYCGEPFTRLAVHADGGLFPCCSDYGWLSPVGTFPETSLQSAWLSDTAKSLRDLSITLPSHPSCRACRGLAPGGGAVPGDAKIPKTPAPGKTRGGAAAQGRRI